MVNAAWGAGFRAPKVDVHDFSMVPRADIPRSTFRIQHQHKTTISASFLYPVFVQEVLPGDAWNASMTCFARISTMLFPILDNMDMESWFFFVPNRIVWSHWVNFCGEQPSTPSDSISYSIPTVTSAAGGFAEFSIYDYMGIPTAGQITGANVTTVNALPFRAYNMIWNQWFRDQNLDNAVGFGATNTVFDIGDGPDPPGNYTVQLTRKRHDYFTSTLPFTQKGAAVQLPLGSTAPVVPTAGAGAAITFDYTGQTGVNTPLQSTTAGVVSPVTPPTGSTRTLTWPLAGTNLQVNLAAATAATINQIRLAFQTQKLLERDARGGTRYTEVIRSHFGVNSPDMRLQRPEYLGGGKTPVSVSPVPQTAQTGLTGGTSPQGQLVGVGTVLAHGHGFRYSATEHGYIIGLVAVRADQVYQQGLHRMWTRSTRYDFYWPVFAMLGEQAVRNDEVFCQGIAGTDPLAFGYQEAWASYRYMPSRTSGAFRSTVAAPLDAWHLAVKLTGLPALSSSWIADPLQTILSRNLAAGGAAANEQFLCDFYFDIKVARPMPMYSVPGLIDHF